MEKEENHCSATIRTKIKSDTKEKDQWILKPE